jgi:hypothetical protein
MLWICYGVCDKISLTTHTTHIIKNLSARHNLLALKEQDGYKVMGGGGVIPFLPICKFAYPTCHTDRKNFRFCCLVSISLIIRKLPFSMSNKHSIYSKIGITSVSMVSLVSPLICLKGAQT